MSIMESFLPNNIYSYCKRSSGGARVARKKPERGHSIAVKMPSCTNLLCTQQNGCTESAKLRNKIMRYFFIKFKIGVTGFEPAASWSQTRRSSQAEPHPAVLTFLFSRTQDKVYPTISRLSTLFSKKFQKILKSLLRVCFHYDIGRFAVFLPWKRQTSGIDYRQCAFLSYHRTMNMSKHYDIHIPALRFPDQMLQACDYIIIMSMCHKYPLSGYFNDLFLR